MHKTQTKKLGFIYRVALQVQWISLSAILSGAVLTFTQHQFWGIYIGLVGIIFYLLSSFIKKKSKSQNDYKADKNGNAKPKYR